MNISDLPNKNSIYLEGHKGLDEPEHVYLSPIINNQWLLSVLLFIKLLGKV